MENELSRHLVSPPSDLLPSIRFEEYRDSDPTQIQFRFSILSALSSRNDRFARFFLRIIRCPPAFPFSRNFPSLPLLFHGFYRMPRHFMQAFLRKLRRRNEQWVHSTHPLREQDRRWDSLGGDEVGNRLVRCKTGLYALSSLSYSVSSNETARNPFAAILSRARSPLLLFLSRRVLIFRTRMEKRGIGGKLFSLGTRRLSRRIFLFSKGITINFSSLFFFLFNSKRKIFG